jgi:hypothetical protein
MIRAKLIFLLTFGILFHCSTDFETDLTTNSRFYRSWEEKTEMSIATCCDKDEMWTFLESDLISLFRFREMLFDTLLMGLPPKNRYVVEEFLSKRSESSVYIINVIAKDLAVEGRVDYQGKINIERKEVRRLFQGRSKYNCCPYDISEYETYKDYLPVICHTIISLEKTRKEPVFEVNLAMLSDEE